MTRVVFETAALADSIKRAAKIAPTRGAAFDKAAGIIFQINPAELESVTLKATNLDVWFMEMLDVIECGGTLVQWRLPSVVFANTIAALPIGSGKTVTMEDESYPGIVLISSGRTKLRINLIKSDAYPHWEAFDDALLEKVSGLGGMLNRVSWACSKREVPFTGIHLTGHDLVACDRIRFAKLPCEVPLDRPITIPFSALGDIMGTESEIRIGVSSNQLLLMPDESTQVRAVIYEQNYPDVSKLLERHRNKPNHIIVPKALLTEAIKRAEQIVRVDRTPKLYMNIGNQLIHLYMADKSAGDIEDVIELPGQCQHEYIKLIFTPKNVSDALDSCPGDQVTIGYDASNPNAVMHLDGGNGYEAFASPRKETGEAG